MTTRVLIWVGVVLLIVGASAWMVLRLDESGGGAGEQDTGAPDTRLQPVAASYLTPPTPAGQSVAPFLTGDKTPRQVGSLEGHEGEVCAMVFTPNGQYLGSAGYGDQTIRVWRVTDPPEEVSRRSCEDRPTGLVIRPDGGQLISIHLYHKLMFWPLSPTGMLGAPVTVEDERIGDLPSLAISPNGLLLATGSYDKRLLLWDAKTHEVLQVIEPSVPLRSLAFSPDGKRLVAGTATNALLLWDLTSGEGKRYLFSRMEESDELRPVLFLPDGQRLLTGSTQPYLCLWGASPPVWHLVYESPIEAAWAPVLTPDGKLVIGAFNQQICGFDVDVPDPPRFTVDGHPSRIESMAMSPTGKRLASSDESGRIVLWRGD